MAKIYGYCRVSTDHQSLDRQEITITKHYPDAEIVKEKCSGTRMNRPAWTALCKKLTAGDVIVFDDIDRMSRNAAEGFKVYQELYTRGIVLRFIKRPFVDTDVYRDTMQIKPTGADTDFDETVIPGINAYLMRLAERQIKIAFDAAEEEVTRKHVNIREGMRASGAGEKISKARTGRTYETKKSKEMKVRIRQMSRDFDGTMTDRDVMEVLGLARNSYYKYKRQMIEAQDDSEDTDE